jgi:hypothetical protein
MDICYMVVIAICVIVATAYITARICNHECESQWQIISYVGNSIVPKNIYICKRCNNKVDIRSCYCSNCGAYMTNGPMRQDYPNEIKLGEELSE